MGQQARATRFACRVLKEIGIIPSTAEWLKRWPDMPRLVPPPYFDKRTDPYKIGFVVVDLGGMVKHVVHKTRRLHNRLAEDGVFHVLCRNNDCQITVITGSEGKATALRLAFAEQDFLCPVDVLVNSELPDFLLRIHQ